MKKEKTKDGEDVFFKALAKISLLTSKSCLWPTFCLMDFMKRYDMLYYHIISLKVD